MKYLIILFTALTALTSCEDFFESTVEVDPPPHIIRLVANMEIDKDDKTFYCALSHSKGSFEVKKYDEDLFVADATIKVFKNDNEFVNLNLFQIPNTNRYLYKGTHSESINSNDKLKLEINHSDYNPIHATAQIPKEISTSEFIKIKKINSNFDDNSTHQVKFDINDQEGEVNFYQVSLERGEYIDGIYHKIEYSDHYLNNINVNEFLETDNGILISDEFFNGTSREFSFGFSHYQLPTENFDDYVIRIKSITEDLYNYKRTITINDNTGDNPFSSPIQVFSNMENGLGILGATNTKLVPIK